MEEKEESNQHRTNTQKEREYDKQLFLLSLVRSLFFALLAAIAE